MMTSDDPTPGSDRPEPVRSGWWRRRAVVVAGAVAVTGIVIAVVVLATRPDSYDNTPEGAAQRFVDVMNDPESTYADIYANACARERREHAGQDVDLDFPGALHFVLDEITQVSDTRAVAVTHLKEIPENSLELALVKEDGVWRDCGDSGL
ncbi:hypothetical protein [Streptomyces muensis]|uniref:DUF4878 domain-containing protein n=1 Tax=Streptomyces muensis TaxID=1077944 RepID=A0A9X1TPM0_STRM4|nr:hypothetical protein [Streptomyces muensis]MCF1599726.1 hypothetical protein [Streptomyces muensis]